MQQFVTPTLCLVFPSPLMKALYNYILLQRLSRKVFSTLLIGIVIVLAHWAIMIPTSLVTTNLKIPLTTNLKIPFPFF